MEEKEKFKNLSVEPDTKILSESYFKVGEYDAKGEVWIWDGIMALSLIFLRDDVEHFSKDELLKIVRSEVPIGDDYTFTDTGEYLLFNYGFKY